METTNSPSLQSITNRSAILILYLITSACAGPSSTRLVSEAQQWNISAELMTDVSIIALIGTSADRRGLSRSANPDAWIDAFWTRKDPSPATSENELHGVLRQRAKYLNRRFPNLDLLELPEPWKVFLLMGPWESALHNLNRESDFWLIYQFPSPQWIPSVAELHRGNYFEYPDLDDVWNRLQDSLLTIQERIEALRSIAWYELPSTAERLLALSDEVRSTFIHDWDKVLLALSGRMAYLGGTDKARHLATLEAIGQPTTDILRKSLASDYDVVDFHTDLQNARNIYARSNESKFLSPHPAIWTEPDSLLERLARDFPMPENPTGWDWRGDLSLSHGPPVWFHPELPVATYIYGIPQYLIRERLTRRALTRAGSAVGRVDISEYRYRSLRSPFEDFKQRLWRPNRVRSVGEDLAEIISIIDEAESDFRVTDDLLEAISALIRHRTYSIEVPEGGRIFPLYASAAVFPSANGPADVLLTLGVHKSNVGSRTAPGVSIGSLNTACVLLDPSFQETEHFIHEGGLVFPSPEMGELNQYLIDTFSFQAATGRNLYYLSALDPSRDTSAGYLIEVRVPEYRSNQGPVLSSLLLASEVSETLLPGGIRRSGTRIVPYPGRNLFYEEPLWLYFEIQNLQESEFGDRNWEESFYIVPDAKDAGIVSIPAAGARSTIKSRVERSFLLDLRDIGGSYEGPFYLLILVRDTESGRYGITAAHLDVAYR